MSVEPRAQHEPERGADDPDRVTHKDASSPVTHCYPDATCPADGGAIDTGNRGHRTAVAGGGLLLAGVALAATNNRPAVTSLASILGEVRDALGATTAWASIITSIPTLCFGVAGIGAPLLARRWGINGVVGVSLAVLTASMLLRVVNGPWTVLAGTVVVCAAIAMCNVLIPVVVKQSFPGRIGMATGLYTTGMAAGGAMGSAFTPFLTSSTGSWRLALATWTVVALAALCVWLAATRSRASSMERPSQAPPEPRRSLLRSPLAWLVTMYFAMQSLVAYVVMGWLPEVFKSAGMDSTSAGALLGLVLMVGVPLSMMLPPLVTKTRGQSGWAVLLALLNIVGMLGLLLAPLSAPVLWALLIGTGMSAFPLALIFVSLRTQHAADTSQLSAMSQSVGYLIASIGPFLFGVVHDAMGGWTASLVLLMGVAAFQGMVGVIVGRPRTI